MLKVIASNPYIFEGFKTLTDLNNFWKESRWRNWGRKREILFLMKEEEEEGKIICTGGK